MKVEVTHADSKLLELAAKAAGYHWPLVWPHPSPVDVPHDWNPLTDDGDALRLAVRLAMTVRQELSAAAAGWGADCLSGVPTVERRGPWFWKEWLSDNQDPFAATRRAIVRAAAEIGKEMK